MSRQKIHSPQLERVQPEQLPHLFLLKPFPFFRILLGVFDKLTFRVSSAFIPLEDILRVFFSTLSPSESCFLFLLKNHWFSLLFQNLNQSPFHFLKDLLI